MAFGNEGFQKVPKLEFSPMASQGPSSCVPPDVVLCATQSFAACKVSPPPSPADRERVTLQGRSPGPALCRRARTLRARLGALRGALRGLARVLHDVRSGNA